MNIRDTIVARRRERIKTEGVALGAEVPAKREVPLVPFAGPPSIICEIKRKSPSRGAIHENVDVRKQIARYIEYGARSISVLTEEDYFSGSLRDLIDAKRDFSDISFLRKDFLLSEDDIETSYRAGADAVLLIASILDRDTLKRLHDQALMLGMTPLVEVHDNDDIEKARYVQSVCTGCNARDLETFRVDLLAPMELSRSIDWKTRRVFESGVWRDEDAAVAASGRFDAVLVGESVMRNPETIRSIINGFSAYHESNGRENRFWPVVAERSACKRAKGLPLVKICGITTEEDALQAEMLGADLLGFIFAESPRRVDANTVRGISERLFGNALRVAVVVSGAGKTFPTDVVDLMEEGHIDAVQFHGDESPDECYQNVFPYYKALRLRNAEDVANISRYRSPRVLVDAYSEDVRGGTGKRIDHRLIEKAAETNRLWLAGGLGADNIGEVVRGYRPELVDASSRLESEPGCKDGKLLKSYFDEIGRCEQ